MVSVNNFKSTEVIVKNSEKTYMRTQSSGKTIATKKILFSDQKKEESPKKKQSNQTFYVITQFSKLPCDRIRVWCPFS